MLELKTFREVYDWDNNCISKEQKIVPFPEEKMTEKIRDGYEKWKTDPIRWEKDKKEEEKKGYQLSHNTITEGVDDLPF